MNPNSAEECCKEETGNGTRKKYLNLFRLGKKAEEFFFFSSDGCYKNTLSLVNGEMRGEGLDI